MWKTFGKPKTGKVIHFAVAGEKSLARCDKTIEVELDEHLIILDVTCKKCQKYRDYAEAVALTDPDAEKKVKPAPKPKTKAKPKVVKKEPAKEEVKTEKTDFVPMSTGQKSKDKYIPEESMKELAERTKKETIIENEFTTKEDKKGKCKIIHVRTNIIFFAGVPELVAKTTCEKLNKIKHIWKCHTDSPPKNFISACRKAIYDSFKEHGLEVPKFVKQKRDIKRREKKVKAEKKTRTIKRREKAPKEKKRTIKRRRDGKTEVITKEPKSIFGMSIKKPTGFIAKLLEEGNTVEDMVKEIKKTFKFNEKKSKRKIKGIVKRLSRKKGVEIVIILSQTENKDHYRIIPEK